MICQKISDETLRRAVIGWLELEGLSDADVSIEDGAGGGLIVRAEGGDGTVALIPPIDLGELSSVVCALSGEIPTVPQPIAVSGEITLDRTKRVLSHGGRSVALSPREFDLLEYLLGKPNVAVSRQELCESVWHGSTSPDTNATDVYISYLRRKIEPIVGKGRLVSVRGVGYMFITQ